MFSDLKRSFTRNTFMKSVLLLASGAAVSNVVTLFFSLFITRIYGPEEYGYLGVFTSVIYMFAPAVALTLPMAIVLAKSEDEAEKISKLSGMIILMISVILLVVVYFFEDELLQLVNAESLGGQGWLVVVAITLAGYFQLNEQWHIRQRGFGTLAKSLNVRAFFIGISQTLTGLVTATGAALILLYTLGMAAQNIFLYKHREFRKKKNETYTYGTILKQYSDFPLYRAPQVLLNSFSFAAPTLMFAWAFGSEVAGFYTIAFALLTVPVTLLGKSVGDVFYKEVVERKNSGGNASLFIIKTTRNLLLLGVIPFGLIALFGPNIFTLLYGEAWLTSGDFARWISLWLLMMLVSRPAIAAVPVLGIQAHLLAHEILSLCVRVGVIYLGVLEQSPLQSIIYLSLANAILYGILILYVFLKSREDASAEKEQEHENTAI